MNNIFLFNEPLHKLESTILFKIMAFNKRYRKVQRQLEELFFSSEDEEKPQLKEVFSSDDDEKHSSYKASKLHDSNENTDMSFPLPQQQLFNNKILCSSEECNTVSDR